MLRISFFASLIFIYVLLFTHLVFAQQDDARKVILHSKMMHEKLLLNYLQKNILVVVT